MERVSFVVRTALVAGLVASSTVTARGQIAWGEVKDALKVSALSGGLSTGPADFSRFGQDVTVLGDVDGDGMQDVAVGAPFDDNGIQAGDRRGAVWVLFMDSDGAVRDHSKISSVEGGLNVPLAPNDQLGTAVEGLGDVDGDGVPDLAAFSAHSSAGGSGSIWILFLNTDGSVRDHTKIEGTPARGDAFGQSLALLGDLDGDGRPELAAGAPGADGSTGTIWILSLTTSGEPFAERRIGGAEMPSGSLDSGDVFGASCARLGDLAGDGSTAIAVGAPHDDDGGFDFGALWILRLSSDAELLSASKISSLSGGFDQMLEPSYSLGMEVEGLGDFNGDGTPDLAIGAPRDVGGCPSTVICGAVWLLFLQPDGSVRFVERIANNEGGLGPVVEWFDEFGMSVTRLPDYDGDGVDDLVVGAIGDDDGGFPTWGASANNGAVWRLALREGTWSNLAQSLAGSLGHPALIGSGGFVPGDVVSIDLSQARPLAQAFLVVGIAVAQSPLKGGILVPSPDFLLALTTDGFGELSLAAPWISGAPEGVSIYFQAWIKDPGGPVGWSASNGLQGTTPVTAD